VQTLDFNLEKLEKQTGPAIRLKLYLKCVPHCRYALTLREDEDWQLCFDIYVIF